jgi:Ca2+-transporting ATPase
MKEIPWGQKTIQETMAFFGTNEERGLNEAEARLRREKYPNELQQDTRINPLVILLNQFTDTMVLVLLGATVISGVIGEMADAITIMAIVTINAILGFAQEYRAEKSLEEIKKLTYAQALVLRGGEKYKIASSQLVPGDIVFLQAGDKVPADIRLIDAVNFEVDEAPLTGESIPVGKNAQLLMTGDTPLAEQKNLSFMGTSVTKGRGTGVVVATGMDTVMGQIAQLMKETERSLTPLQLRLDSLGKNLIVICLVVCAVVSFLGIIRGEDIMTMLMAGISLAVAAIPEGLPAIVTIVLALGVQRMANRNAIVRKLPAVETLGCTTVICSDKTGTLTQNKMLVRKVAVFERELAIPGEEYSSFY